MSKNLKQTELFRGIYDFQDPSGSLLAARVPYEGHADLYHGTTLVVRPNQCAILVYKGKLADLFTPGTHTLVSEVVPILSKLANAKFGFRNPVRCEIIFFSGQAFVGRRWGTAQPAIVSLQGTPVALRGFGNYSVRVKNPTQFYLKLVGTRAAYSVADLETYIQGVLVELLPAAIQSAGVVQLSDLGPKQTAVATALGYLAAEKLGGLGLQVVDVQLLALLPSKEILEAMDEKLAMEIVGDKREYLLYKAASTMDALTGGTANSDPMHMMMGLMLSRNLLGADYREKEGRAVAAGPVAAKAHCASCQAAISVEHKFCPNCGKERAK